MAWEMLQRAAAGNTDPMTNEQIAELCGLASESGIRMVGNSALGNAKLRYRDIM